MGVIVKIRERARMCYSAEVSFASASTLIPMGVYCLRAAAVKAPRYWPLAAIPLFFGIQQVAEGLVWTGVARADRPMVAVAAQFYLFFAMAFWPTWFSLSAFLIETRSALRRCLAAWTVLSTGWFFIYYLPMALGAIPVEVLVVRHSIRYEHPWDAAALSVTARTGLRLLYLFTAAVPLLLTSERRKLYLPVALGTASAVVAAWSFDYAFTSVWCLLAAVCSTYTTYRFAVLPKAKDQGILGQVGGDDPADRP